MTDVRRSRIDLGERSSEGFVGQVSPTMTLYFHFPQFQPTKPGVLELSTKKGRQNPRFSNTSTSTEKLNVFVFCDSIRKGTKMRKANEHTAIAYAPIVVPPLDS
jgi:hypothetical protein